MLQYSQQSIRSITLSPLHSPSKSIVATSFIIPLQLSQLLNLHCKYPLTLGDTEFSICTNTYLMWMTAGYGCGAYGRCSGTKTTLVLAYHHSSFGQEHSCSGLSPYWLFSWLLKKLSIEVCVCHL